MNVKEEKGQKPSNRNAPANCEQPATKSGDTWDEERLEDAMKTLKEMHIQLRGLRTTVPRLLSPLTTRQPSPEILLQEFKRSAKTANTEVQDFHRLMNSEQSKVVLTQARESRAENPFGIKPWKVSDHPTWLTRDK